MGKKLHKVCRLDQNSGFHGNRKRPLTYNGENDVHFFSVFNQILFKLAGNEDRHKISDKFEFWPDRTTPYGLRCLDCLKHFLSTYNAKMVSPS